MTSAWMSETMTFVETIVSHLKSHGTFDQFRYDCLSDVDTKPAYQNLIQRTEGYVSKFLSTEEWSEDLNKNELRNKLRRQIEEAGNLASGVDHVVDQVVNPKINRVFMPKIEEVVIERLNYEKQKKFQSKPQDDIESPAKSDDKNLSKNKNAPETSVIKDEPASTSDMKAPSSDSSRHSSIKSTSSQGDVKSKGISKLTSKLKQTDKDKSHKSAPKTPQGKDVSKSTERSKDDSSGKTNLKTGDRNSQSKSTGKSNSEKRATSNNDERDAKELKLPSTSDSKNVSGKQKDRGDEREKSSDQKNKIKTHSSSSKPVPSSSSKSQLHKDKSSSKTHLAVKEHQTSKSASIKVEPSVSHSTSDDVSKGETPNQKKRTGDKISDGREIPVDAKKHKEVVEKKSKSSAPANINPVSKEEHPSSVESDHCDDANILSSSFVETDDSMEIDETTSTSSINVNNNQDDPIITGKALSKNADDLHMDIDIKIDNQTVVSGSSKRSNKLPSVKETKDVQQNKMVQDETSSDKSSVDANEQDVKTSKSDVKHRFQEKVNNMNPTLIIKSPRLRKNPPPVDSKDSFSKENKTLQEEPTSLSMEKIHAADDKSNESVEMQDISEEPEICEVSIHEEEIPSKQRKKSKEHREFESDDTNLLSESLVVEPPCSDTFESDSDVQLIKSSNQSSSGRESDDVDSGTNVELDALSEGCSASCVSETVTKPEDMNDSPSPLSGREPKKEFPPAEGCSTNTRPGLRRKRKLNPKYASSDYMSIFDDAKDEESPDDSQMNPEDTHSSKMSEGSATSQSFDSNPNRYDFANVNKNDDDDDDQLVAPARRSSKRLRSDSSTMSERKKSSEMLETSSDSDNFSQKGDVGRRRRSHSSRQSTSSDGKASSKKETLRQRQKTHDTRGSSSEQSKNPADSQKASKTQSTTHSTKRYDSSDLYKPRLVRSTSRRNKGPPSPN